MTYDELKPLLGKIITFTYGGKESIGKLISFNSPQTTCVVKREGAPMGRSYIIKDMKDVKCVQ